MATTIFPYYDFVRQIAGDKVELRLVVPAGMDSHSFEPTPADMIHIQEADLFVYNGGEMERWVEEVLESVGDPGMRVVCMMDSVDVLEEEVVEGMEDDPHGHHDHGGDGAVPIHGEHDGYVRADGGHDGQERYAPGQLHEVEYDEHIWTSPVNAMKIVERICQALEEADPENGAFYRERAGAYIQELKGLDEDFRQVVEDGRWDMIIVGDLSGGELWAAVPGGFCRVQRGHGAQRQDDRLSDRTGGGAAASGGLLSGAVQPPCGPDHRGGDRC